MCTYEISLKKLEIKPRHVYLQFMKCRKMIPPGLEPGTFRVLGERDNRYTTESLLWKENFEM